jgi:hypothetical protein
MKVRKVNVSQTLTAVRKTWRTKRWLRVIGYGLIVTGLYSTGHDAGLKEGDPRNTNTGPGSTVSITQLEGEWDGVGTTPDGRPFCLKGWPCEDLPEGPQSWLDK